MTKPPHGSRAKASLEPANLGRFTARDSVVIERLLPAPVEKVWDYLTKPARLRTWLAGGKVDPRKGGIIHLDFDLIDCPGREEMHGTMLGTITEYDPPRLLAYAWRENRARLHGIPDSMVTFELQPVSNGQTLLKVTHTRLKPKDMSPVAAGWHAHVDVLTARLNGREPGPFKENYQSLEPQYRKLLELSRR